MPNKEEVCYENSICTVPIPLFTFSISPFLLYFNTVLSVFLACPDICPAILGTRRIYCRMLYSFRGGGIARVQTFPDATASAAAKGEKPARPAGRHFAEKRPRRCRRPVPSTGERTVCAAIFVPGSIRHIPLSVQRYSRYSRVSAMQTGCDVLTEQGKKSRRQLMDGSFYAFILLQA